MGGVLLSFILVFFLDTFEVLTLLLLINVVILSWLTYKKVKRALIIRKHNPGLGIYNMCFCAAPGYPL